MATKTIAESSATQQRKSYLTSAVPESLKSYWMWCSKKAMYCKIMERNLFLLSFVSWFQVSNKQSLIQDKLHLNQFFLLNQKHKEWLVYYKILLWGSYLVKNSRVTSLNQSDESFIGLNHSELNQYLNQLLNLFQWNNDNFSWTYDLKRVCFMKFRPLVLLLR